MKLRILFILTVILYLNFAVSCADEDPMWRIVDLDVKNMDNKNDQPFVSNDSIRKEAYALDILYLGKNIDNSMDYNRIDFKNCKDTIIDQRIICNNDFDIKHLSGSDITDFFKPIYGYYNKYDTKILHGGTFVLTKYPQPGIHSFKIRVFRNNGTYIEKNTVPIKLY